MYFEIVALVLGAMSSSALAGAADYQRLPNCARAAFLRAAAISECALSDTGCVCQTTQLANQFKNVVPFACPGKDFARAYRTVCQICPNLKTIFPSADIPILRIHPTSKIDDPGHGDLAPSMGTYNADSNAPPPVETKAPVNGPTPPPLPSQGTYDPYESHGQGDDQGHGYTDNVDEPNIMPANVAASVAGTPSASDSGGTSVLGYSTAVPLNNPVVTAAELSTGRAAHVGGNWLPVVTAAFGAIAFAFLMM